MEEYTFLRALADSWGLLAMFVFFVGMVIWVLLPSRNRIHDDCKNIPFRHEDEPAEEKEART